MIITATAKVLLFSLRRLRISDSFCVRRLFTSASSFSSFSLQKVDTANWITKINKKLIKKPLTAYASLLGYNTMSTLPTFWRNNCLQCYNPDDEQHFHHCETLKLHMITNMPVFLFTSRVVSFHQIEFCHKWYPTDSSLFHTQAGTTSVCQFSSVSLVACKKLPV